MFGLGLLTGVADAGQGLRTIGARHTWDALTRVQVASRCVSGACAIVEARHADFQCGVAERSLCGTWSAPVTAGALSDDPLAARPRPRVVAGAGREREAQEKEDGSREVFCCPHGAGA